MLASRFITNKVIIGFVVVALVVGSVSFQIGKQSQQPMQKPGHMDYPKLTEAPLQQAQPTQSHTNLSEDVSEEYICLGAGGTWRQFPNGCVDACGIGPETMCTQAFTFGCDCGPNACWTGTECR